MKVTREVLQNSNQAQRVSTSNVMVCMRVCDAFCSYSCFWLEACVKSNPLPFQRTLQQLTCNFSRLQTEVCTVQISQFFSMAVIGQQRSKSGNVLTL